MKETNSLDLMIRKGLIKDYSILPKDQYYMFPCLIIYLKINHKDCYIRIDKFDEALLYRDDIAENIIKSEIHKIIDNI